MSDLLARAKADAVTERDLSRWVAHQPRDLVDAAARQFLIQELRRERRMEALAVEREHQIEQPTSTAQPVLMATEEAAAIAPAISQRIAALRAAVDGMIDRHARDLIMDWTPTILAQELRMPDGRSTTWGRATVEDHAARAAMYAEQATAGIEGAARHRKAISDLTATGCTTLNDLSRARAA